MVDNPYEAYGDRGTVQVDLAAPGNPYAQFDPTPSASGRYVAESPTNVAVAPPGLRWPVGLANAGLEGGALGLGAPGDLAEFGRQYIENPLRHEWGLPQAQSRALPTSTELLDLVHHFGLAGPEFAPQGPGERMARAGVRGAVAAVPTLALGQPMVPAVMGGAGGSLAAQGGAELGLDPTSQFALGTVAGLTAQGAGYKMSRGLPGIAKSLGSSTSLEDAGSIIQRDAANWRLNVMPQRMADFWAPVDRLIPPSTDTHLTNFQTALGAINTSAGSLQPLVDALSPGLPKRLAGLLGGTPAGTGQPVPWEEVQRLRTVLGDAKTTPKIVQDIGAQNLDHLYAALSSDMRDAAHGVSPAARDAFDSANGSSHRLYNFAQKYIGKIVKEPDDLLSPANPSPGNVARVLLAGGRLDGQAIDALRQELPSAMNELAAAHLRMSPDGRAWQSMSPGAQASLVTSTRDRAILDAITNQPGTMDRLLHTGASQLGAWVGADAGALLGEHFGLPGNTLVHEAGGGLIGATIPLAGRMGRRVLRNPLTLAPPILGAESGTNY